MCTVHWVYAVDTIFGPSRMHSLCAELTKWLLSLSHPYFEGLNPFQNPSQPLSGRNVKTPREREKITQLIAATTISTSPRMSEMILTKLSRGHPRWFPKYAQYSQQFPRSATKWCHRKSFLMHLTWSTSHALCLTSVLHLTHWKINLPFSLQIIFESWATDVVTTLKL